MKLIIFHGDAVLLTHSPFCLKAMCLLEMAGQDWAPEYIQDLSTMPMGRVPVLEQESGVSKTHSVQDPVTGQGTVLAFSP